VFGTRLTAKHNNSRHNNNNNSQNMLNVSSQVRGWAMQQYELISISNGISPAKTCHHRPYLWYHVACACFAVAEWFIDAC
jgi:hypothetical protein